MESTSEQLDFLKRVIGEVQDANQVELALELLPIAQKLASSSESTCFLSSLRYFQPIDSMLSAQFPTKVRPPLFEPFMLLFITFGLPSIGKLSSHNDFLTFQYIV